MRKKKLSWKFTLPVFIGLLLCFFNVSTEMIGDHTNAAQVKYVKLAVDGQPVFSDEPARIINKQAWVPLKIAAGAVGAQLSWDQPREEITVKKGDCTLKITINNRQAFINEKAVELPAIPQLINNYTFVPLRFLLDAWGYKANWDGVSRTVNIVTAEPVLPAVKSNSASPNTLLPILMYHEIGDGPNSLYVADRDFRRQMEYLHSNGYKTVTVSEALEMLCNNEDTTKVIAITFDDGYRSFYTKAWPILKEYGFVATVFVISGLQYNDNYLNAEQIKVLNANWIEIGSHTVNHPALTSLSRSRLESEIIESKSMLEEITDGPVKSFCYPSGEFNRQIVDLVKMSGYSAAVTTQYGKASAGDDACKLPRIRINRGISIEEFAKRL